MRRMKDSGIAWIGEIPEEWEIKKLKYITYCNKNTLQENTDAETRINYIDISSVSELYGIIETQEFNFHDAPSRARRIVHCGDVIISTVRTYLRAVSYIEKIYDNYICSTGFAVLTPMAQELSSKFMYYTLFSDFFVSTVEKLSVGISYPAITAENLHSIRIPVPPLPEQHRIADYLDAKCAEIDSSMELVRQGMDKLKAYKMSVITEAVTKGLDPDVPMKDSGVPWIGEMPEGWEIIRLKFIAPVQGGYSFKAEKFSTEHGIPLVRMNNLKRGTLNLEDAVKIQEEDILEEFFINENDILIGLSGSLGDTGSLGNYAVASKGDLPCLLNQRVGRFTVSKSIKYKLIVYFLDTDFFKQPLILDSNGTAQFNISPYDIGEVLVPLPSRSEQQDIIAYLDTKCAEIDAVIAKKQELLDKLAAYKKSLIFECVTGKREVAA